MNILYLSDNNYAIFMGVSIVSLFENNKALEEINVYIIDDKISYENRNLLRGIGEKYNRKLIFLDISEGIKKLKELEAPLYRGSYTTYLKLFTFQLLPDDVHRIMFIDSDTCVVGSLAEIESFDLQENPIAAVLDNLSVYDKTHLGYEQDCVWGNMGVMLVDVDKWKEMKCEHLIVNQMKQRSAYVAVDQNLLNISLHGHIAILPPQYNLTQHHLVYSYDAFLKHFPMNVFYSKQEMKVAKEYPVIHHFERFIGESPWHKNNITIFNDEFDYYLSLSPWKGYQKLSSDSSFVLKVEKLLYKILPHDVFLRIYRIAYKHYITKLNRKLEKGISNITM